MHCEEIILKQGVCFVGLVSALNSEQELFRETVRNFPALGPLCTHPFSSHACVTVVVMWTGSGETRYCEEK